MLIQKKESPVKNIILFSILAVIVLVIGFLLYRNYFQPAGAPQAAPGVLPLKIITTFNKAIFSDEKFLRLIMHGEFPITIKATGNQQPFK